MLALDGLLRGFNAARDQPRLDRNTFLHAQSLQKAVEGQHFEARKHILEYDDVMNKQREAVYGLRRQLLEGLDQKELIVEDYVRDILGSALDKYAGKDTHPQDWDIKGLKNETFTKFGVDIEKEGVEAEKLNRQELGDAI